jgi:6-phosphogluconolactonase (cycloisomerase 2 family)
MLTACNPVTVKGGTGPRHATFWMPANASAGSNSTMLYVANELANTVNAFSVSYPASGCPVITLTQSLSPFPNGGSAPSGTKVAEVHTKGSFLYNTNRVDKSFSGNDSITAWSISSTGAISEIGFTDVYGTYPRTFSINSAGTLVAIGDQTTANVVIVSRNTTTGLLGSLVANLRIGSTGIPENENGLSSVVFAD